MRLSSRRCCFGTPNAPREIHSRVICDRKAKKKQPKAAFHLWCAVLDSNQ